MNSMKNPWVKDLTSFFESLGKTNIRSTSRKRRDSKACKIDPSIKDSRSFIIEEKIVPTNQLELTNSLTSLNSDHCVSVKDARNFFEKMNSVDSPYFVGMPGGKPLKKRQASTFDIFSGVATDLDIPPIEAEIEEDGVYPTADTVAGRNSNKSAASSATSAVRQGADKRKSVVRSPSYAARKSAYKAGGKNFKTVVTEMDVEKENDGVIIRMKNQEIYYDGRDKYRSLLPEAPLVQLVENKRGRRSLLTQKAVEKSIDLADCDESREHPHMNSIMLQDVSLPSIDTNHISVDKVSQGDDNDSDELEPNGECDSYSEIKVLQLISQGPQRIKWAETEEGKKLIRIKDLSSEIIKWQEAQFEVITSEASYYRSLETLVNKIYKSPYMSCQGEKKQLSLDDNENVESSESYSPSSQGLMTPLQKHHLFSNILEIHISSGDLLKALETRWRENPLIEDLSDILVEFSKEKLRPYITYLRNQQYQTSTYNQLLTKPEFQNAIRNIETDLDCGMMNLSSFLLLPMQRLLRLKLLFTVVRHYIPPGYPVQGCEAALVSLEAVIKESSDQKVLMEQKEVIMKIYNRLSFKQQTGASIGSSPLLKDGPMKVNPSNKLASKALNSSFMNRNNNRAQLYLFEDQLIIAKTRKLPLCLSSSDDREMVVDICLRSEVQFDASVSSKPVPFAKGSQNNHFKLVLKKGLKGSAEYTCEAESRDDLENWKKVFAPGANEWEQFEFNDVLVVKDFVATSSKELDLKRGQILSITRRLNDRKAIATSGDRQGEIPLSHVQFVSSPQPNPELMMEIKESIGHKKVD